MLESGGREVGEEDLPASRGLPADVFREITQRHIDGICSLASKHGQLCLVGGDDDGDESRAGLLLLELLLQKR